MADRAETPGPLVGTPGPLVGGDGSLGEGCGGLGVAVEHGKQGLPAGSVNARVGLTCPIQ